MKPLVEVAALISVLLAVSALTLASNNSDSSSSNNNNSISRSNSDVKFTNTSAQQQQQQQQQQNSSSQKIEGVATVTPKRTEEDVYSALQPRSELETGPSGFLSVVVYATVLVTIGAMIYLAVRNFRMRYDTVRAERYGFRLRSGRRDHEVEPLARDEEDEEILFDVRGELR